MSGQLYAPAAFPPPLVHVG